MFSINIFSNTESEYLELFKTGNRQEKLDAARTLEEMKSKEAVGLLISAYYSKEEKSRNRKVIYLKIIGKIGGVEAEHFIIDELISDDLTFSHFAGASLRKMNKIDRSSISRLNKIMNESESPSVKFSARYILKKQNRN